MSDNFGDFRLAALEVASADMRTRMTSR